jgi:chromosome segregation ATPase
VANIFDKVKTLREKLLECKQELKNLENSKNQSLHELKAKEKELEDWRAKLELCQQEKKQIEKDIKDKVAELEKSNLSNSEKQEKINKLLTEHRQELEEIGQQLEGERTSYRNIRNKLINKLCEPCRGCQEKNAILLKVNQKADNLFITL